MTAEDIWDQGSATLRDQLAPATWAAWFHGVRPVSYDGDARVLIDFTVVNLGGGPTVVEMWHQDDAPSQMVDQITRSRNSVTFVSG